jgi:hypothetical protein
MPFFGSSQDDDILLTAPATKRISAPNAHRLTTITETGQGPRVEDDGIATPPIPRRSSRRNSGGAAHSFNNSKRWSDSTATTLKTAPPPYDWVPEPETGTTTTISGPDNDEKLARLRRGEDSSGRKRRGGWLRLGLIIGAVLLVVIALAVGLGVGLTRKKSNNSNQSSSSTSGSGSKPPQKFPLGEYSMVTALMSIDYGCASNQATWSCWPYTIYSPSTTQSSLATFNWIIRNTSEDYATPSSPSTPAEGVPANLQISSTEDPFGISFTSKPLTFISQSGNSSAARLTFTFSMNKVVIPSQPITTTDANSKCFFNATTFTGTLYLSAPRNYPGGDLQTSNSSGGFQQWPYAVEITQTANGGTDVPNCYETTNGQLGQQIFNPALVAMPSTDQCSCDYRNF